MSIIHVDALQFFIGVVDNTTIKVYNSVIVGTMKWGSLIVLNNEFVDDHIGAVLQLAH